MTMIKYVTLMGRPELYFINSQSEPPPTVPRADVCMSGGEDPHEVD